LFHDLETFRRGFVKLMKAAAAIEAPDYRHLLIISAHGKPRTGTDLALEDGTGLDLFRVRDLFQVLPCRFTIYVSVCWGGYIRVRQALSAATPRPIFIGPLVNIGGDHSLALQDQLVDRLLAGDDALDLARNAVSEFNRRHEDSYGRPVFCAELPDGEQVPESIEPGLAAPLENRRSYLVVASQRLRPGDPEPRKVVLWDGQSYWQAWAAQLGQPVSAQELVGRVFKFRARVHVPPVQPMNIGKLEIDDRVHLGHPNSLPHTHRYAHMSEPGRPEPRPVSVEGAAVTAGCRSCSWAVLEWPLWQVGRGTPVQGVRGSCCRTELPCPARA
jgi:hypothetical protein